MSFTRFRARIFVASVLVTGGGALVLPSIAAAHHNTVSCQSPGVWLISNSEADRDQSFTTNEGHSGDIPAGGSITVNYSGTSLIVYGTWTGGATSTATGEGACTEETTTTTTEAPTTTATPTTEAVTPTTEAVTTTAAPTTTAGIGATTTVAPSTTIPVVSVLPQVAATTPAADPNDPAGETSGMNQTLPATGSSSATSVAVGSFLLLLGGAALVGGRRKPDLAD